MNKKGKKTRKRERQNSQRHAWQPPPSETRRRRRPHGRQGGQLERPWMASSRVERGRGASSASSPPSRKRLLLRVRQHGDQVRAAWKAFSWVSGWAAATSFSELRWARSRPERPAVVAAAIRCHCPGFAMAAAGASCNCTPVAATRPTTACVTSAGSDPAGPATAISTACCLSSRSYPAAFLDMAYCRAVAAGWAIVPTP